MNTKGTGLKPFYETLLAKFKLSQRMKLLWKMRNPRIESTAQKYDVEEPKER